MKTVPNPNTPWFKTGLARPLQSRERANHQEAQGVDPFSPKTHGTKQRLRTHAISTHLPIPFRENRSKTLSPSHENNIQRGKNKLAPLTNVERLLRNTFTAPHPWNLPPQSPDENDPAQVRKPVLVPVPINLIRFDL